MRIRDCAIAATVVAGLSGTALAQTPPATPAPPTQTITSTAPNTVGTTESHWTAAGFVGSNFGGSAESPSLDFGAQVAYLGRGIIGAEALAGFAPDFKLDNAFLAEDPTVNTYMANAIGALPLGAEGEYQPYLSSGFGAIQLKTDVQNRNADNGTSTTAADQMRSG